MMSSGTSVTGSRRSRICWGLLSKIVSHGLKNVVWFLTMGSRFIASACWKRAYGSLTGERIAM